MILYWHAIIYQTNTCASFNRRHCETKERWVANVCSATNHSLKGIRNPSTRISNIIKIVSGVSHAINPSFKPSTTSVTISSVAPTVRRSRKWWSSVCDVRHRSRMAPLLSIKVNLSMPRALRAIHAHNRWEVRSTSSTKVNRIVWTVIWNSTLNHAQCVRVHFHRVRRHENVTINIFTSDAFAVSIVAQWFWRKTI